MPSKFILFKHVRCAFLPHNNAAKTHALVHHTLRAFELAWRQRASAFFGGVALLRHFLFWEGNVMPDYEKLYHLMVNAAEDALAALEDANIWDARRILIDAEQRAEENYVTSMD